VPGEIASPVVPLGSSAIFGDFGLEKARSNLHRNQRWGGPGQDGKALELAVVVDTLADGGPALQTSHGEGRIVEAVDSSGEPPLEECDDCSTAGERGGAHSCDEEMVAVRGGDDRTGGDALAAAACAGDRSVPSLAAVERQ
jgi:hypothetical protein